MKTLYSALEMIQRSCEITSGHTKANCTNPGGIKSWVVLSHENMASYTLDAAESQITAITLEDTKKGYEIVPDLDSSNYVQTPTRSRENGTYFVAQTAMIKLKDDTVETQDLTSVMGKGFILLIARQNNGVNRVLGLLNGMTLETEENASGELYEDLNGSIMNFTGKELIKAPVISDVLLDALLIPAS